MEPRNYLGGYPNEEYMHDVFFIGSELKAEFDGEEYVLDERLVGILLRQVESDVRKMERGMEKIADRKGKWKGVGAARREHEREERARLIVVRQEEMDYIRKCVEVANRGKGRCVGSWENNRMVAEVKRIEEGGV